jgi:hypothetical protein
MGEKSKWRESSEERYLSGEKRENFGSEGSQSVSLW